MRGDPSVLHSAIDNVVRNALLHGDRQQPIEVTLSNDADAVRIAVRDHGAGVRDEDLPHIFEPFYRAGAKDSNHVSTGRHRYRPRHHATRSAVTAAGHCRETRKAAGWS